MDSNWFAAAGTNLWLVGGMLGTFIAIRSELSLRNLPIVALTANAGPEDRTRCLGVGMSDFLTKPVRYQRLLDVLHKWMPARDSTLPARSEPQPSYAANPLEQKALGLLDPE